MTKSAFQIPDHVAIQMFVYAPPRRILSLNIGASGDCFPARLGKKCNNAGSLATISVDVEACSWFVWANSANVCSAIVTGHIILDGPNHY